MRIKDLFTVPEGEKVTEKVFGRVLISSVCGILLTMACLFSTTWAWFAVSIENQGNVIEITAITPEVEIHRADETPVTPMENGSYSLGPDTYTVKIKLKENGQTPETGKPAYVILTVKTGEAEERYCFAFETRTEEKTQKIVVQSGSPVFSFAVSWAEPVSDIPSADKTVVIGTILAEE